MSILILHGEDSLTLDKYFLQIRKNYQKVVYFEQLPQLTKLQETVLSQGFFPEKTVYVFKNFLQGQLNRGKFSKKAELVSNFLLKETANDYILIEEDKDKIKYYKNKFAKASFKEFKLPLYLFYFLDSVRPKNFNKCFFYLKKTMQKTAVELVLYMLKKIIKRFLEKC